jgi:glucose-6-phosphate dehydrogenase assembly protein OpcA
MYGRLALHAESITLPLLAPDAPVVTWWYGIPPEQIAYDPLGVFAERRITDAVHGADRIDTLRQRAKDYAPGDTDLSWTRITPWRAVLASAFDTAAGSARSATVRGDQTDPAALLLAGWLSSRLGFYVPVEAAHGGGVSAVSVTFDDDTAFDAVRDGGRLVLRRTNQQDTITPFPERVLGDLLAEELRRLDADRTYGSALGAVNGLTGLNERSNKREHVWNDPALAAVANA